MNKELKSLNEARVAPLWTLKDGLKAARHVEEMLGGHFHVGLAGSVLVSGQSQKDLDLIVYPHSGGDVDKEAVTRLLRAGGMARMMTDGRGNYPDGRVGFFTYRGKRVDILFLD
jgi:hypothetical protein